MNIREFLTSDYVLADLAASGKAGLLQGLAQRASEKLKLPAELISSALLKREELGSTGTGGGIAIPHRLMSHHDPHTIIGQGATFDMVNLSLQNDKDHLATRVSHQFNLRGPEHHGPDRLLVVAGRRARGLPEPAVRRMRHGTGRRRPRSGAAPPRLLHQRRIESCRPDRPLPRLRRARGRHAVRQRRGRWWCCADWRTPCATATTSTR